ncbi:MAG: type IV pilus assembly protein PilP [Candidatus Nitrotoga sp. SPKER]|nr:MAG: type IV pilus assembly protein PilP [Candidatus Nitrotoga sp. SPKER]
MRPAYLLLFTSLLLSACAEEEFQDLRNFVKDTGSEMRGKVDPPPEIKPYEPYAYNNSTGLPDPFKPRKSEAKNGDLPGPNQPDMKRRREALEESPLESLKMVGFLYKTKVGHAIVRSSDGKLHQVKIGNHLGSNFGQIISITETEVKIKEIVQDSAGDWAERINSLSLLE